MTSLTVSIPQDLKASLRKKIKKEGVTLTFVVNKMLSAYNEGNLSFEITHKKNNEDEVTAFFDISTPEGKKKCFDDFTALANA